MGGSGSMTHAISSLKANKQERNNFARLDLRSPIYTDSLVFKKLNRETCTKTAKRINFLKGGENARLNLIIFIVFAVANLVTMFLIAPWSSL